MTHGPHTHGSSQAAEEMAHALFATSIPMGVALLTALAWTRKVAWAWTLLGALLLDTVCLWLKSLIAQPRPLARPQYVLPSEGPYGMPSEHAAFAAYLLVHLTPR